MKSWSAFVLGCCLVSGCTVGVSDEGGANTGGIPCSSDADCGAEMSCKNGLCQGQAPSVLVAVAFPASENLADYSASSFVMMLDGQGDIMLPELESLSVDASLDQLGAKSLGCSYDRKGHSSWKVSAVLSHQWPINGLEQNPPHIAADLPTKFSALPIETDYEVYLSLSDDFQAALKAQSSSCALPPVLFRDVAVGSVSAITLTWPSPKTITVDVQMTPISSDCISDLQGWQLDVVDPVDGRELAIPVTLGAAVADVDNPKTTHYHATLSYNPITSASLSPPVGTEMLRLQPPSVGISPVYYAALSALSLFGTASDFVMQLNGVPSPVVLTGRVEAEDSGDPIEGAEVTFSNPEFSVLNLGLAARFWGSAKTDSSGQFEIAVPSGKYQVVAIPPNDGTHASLETSWTIQPTPQNQGGRLISIPLFSHLTGSIDGSVHWGSSASATIQATPSSRVLVDTVTNVATIRQSSTGARTAWVPFPAAQTSNFDLLTDLGTFDVSMRTPEGLPWIVSVGFDMHAASEAMSPWSMPLPVSWSGHLRVPAANSGDHSNLDDLPRAVLRVFVLLDGDRKQVLQTIQDGAWISQIAETRAEADGSFSLVLPDRLQPQ